MASLKNANSALKALGKRPATYRPESRIRVARKYSGVFPIEVLAMPRNAHAAIKKSARRMAR